MRSPRVVMVTSYFEPHVGGVETVVQQHAIGLARRGWDVSILTSRLRGDPAMSRIPGATVYRVRALNPFENAFHVPVPIPSPLMVRTLIRHTPEPDVIVAHGHVYLTTQLAAVAAKRMEVPLVVVQHNPFVDYPAPIEWCERLADHTIGRRVLERSARVASVSSHTEAYVKQIAPHAMNAVIPNGVDTSRFTPGEVTLPSRPSFVTLRRLVARNGVDVLVRAWRQSGLDGRADLVIGGSGPERSRLEALASGMSSVRFAGFVPDEQVVSMYRTATAAIMPTTSGEGFGLMAAEALACGTPVIASAEGALPELVRHEATGLLVRPGDPAALAAAMQRLAGDPSLRSRLAGNARGLDLSWDRVIDSLDALLHSVIDEERPKGVSCVPSFVGSDPRAAGRPSSNLPYQQGVNCILLDRLEAADISTAILQLEVDDPMQDRIRASAALASSAVSWPAIAAQQQKLLSGRPPTSPPSASP
jgi:D-inositol-3-phosphate glycosyltransferase